MEVAYLKEPFEHLIISNVFSEDELNEVVNEINFLENKFLKKQLNQKVNLIYDKNSIIDGSYTRTSTDLYGRTRSTKKSIYLDELFVNIKDLFLINSISHKLKKHIVPQDFFTQVIISYVDRCTATLSFWTSGDEYEVHLDEAMLTCMFYYIPNDQIFEGGEIAFGTNGNYKIKPKNNSIILFPGWVHHSVTKIKTNDNYPKDQIVRVGLSLWLGIEKL